MLKKILAIVAMLYAFSAFAAVDVNKATSAELDAIKGIGPSISSKILDERKKGAFKDWNDFIVRVKGIGEGNAAKFSDAGLTVNGGAFKAAAVKADAKANKKEAKADAKADKAVAKAEVKADKKEAKADAKADKMEAKADAKADKAVAKAEPAKPAASVAKK